MNIKNRISFEEIAAALDERHTQEIRKKLWDSSVSVAGLGGIGSNTAVMLARAGVGNLHLADFDVVDITNLNRQAYAARHIGMKKTEAIKEIITDINPYINIKTEDVYINESNVSVIFRDTEILCEAFDAAENKAMLINTALAEIEGIKVVSGSGMAGCFDSNLIKTKKITGSLYVCGDGVNGIESGNHLMSPRVSICAGHQANMIIRLILGYEK